MDPRGKGSSQSALVLGSDSRAFLAVIRSLGRAGITVHVAWCPPNATALHSKYVSHVHDIPAPASTDAWVEPLVALALAERIDLVIPCDDPSSLPLYARRAEVEPKLRVAILAQDAFDVVNSKARTYALGELLGLSVPQQLRVSDPTSARAIADDLGLPVVVKPNSSFTLAGLDRKREVKVARTEEELAGLLTTASADEPLLAQTYFAGTGVGVEVLAAEGEVLVAFQHRRVHEPLDGGGSSYRCSEPPIPALLDATRKLMRALRYTGVGMVEFRVDIATGEWILVEINGRFWGSLPLAVAAGADFPAFLFDLLVDGRREFPQSFRNGIFARNWDRDFDWLLKRTSARRRGLSGVRSALPLLLGELRHFIAGRERSDTFVLDDPAPGLAEVRSMVGRLTGKFTRKLRALAGRLPMARALAARRALRAWRDARHVLFVCKGNICRSPYAAYRATHVDSKIREFRSAGYWPRVGRRSPADGIEAARQLGIDLSEHRSARLDNASIAWADAIFVFDDENRTRVRGDFPAAVGKVHLLGVVDGGPQTIEDPYGQSRETFLSCYRRIDRSINRFVSRG